MTDLIENVTRTYELINQISVNQACIEALAANKSEAELADLRVIWRGMQADKRALEAHLQGLTNARIEPS